MLLKYVLFGNISELKMKQARISGISIREVNLQRKFLYAIIFGGIVLTILMLFTIETFVKGDQDLMEIVFISAAVLSLTPAVLKLSHLNSLLKSK
ncbi:hypothetical protein SAMN05421877_10782 [Sphingobacterium lactis]|uniref:Uncharacterized protein n=2 Tax=Sphingobacterium lactis TaxID=797291 RepID=A0A1H5ZLS5_9SPHI|nr:hypothetical protein SAMN05421877_10782 [Sphingobacterium lactis]